MTGEKREPRRTDKKTDKNQQSISKIRELAKNGTLAGRGESSNLRQSSLFLCSIYFPANPVSKIQKTKTPLENGLMCCAFSNSIKQTK